MSDDAAARIARALEALAAGDIAYATRILEDAEHELRELVVGRRHRCPHCGAAYRWPGELDEHLRFSGCSQRPEKAA